MERNRYISVRTTTPSEVDKVLSERYGDDYYTDMTDEQEAEAYAGLPWVKAIIVNIDLPE